MSRYEKNVDSMSSLYLAITHYLSFGSYISTLRKINENNKFPSKKNNSKYISRYTGSMYDSHVIIICHIIYGAFFFFFFYITQSHYGSVLHIWQSQFCVFHICHIPTVWYVVVFIFVIFQQCGMLCFSYLLYSDSVVCCVLHFTSTNHGCFHILQSNYCDFSYSYQIVISTQYINFWKSHCYLSNK